jgi:CDP-glycerol glycerophosphotransferase
MKKFFFMLKQIFRQFFWILYFISKIFPRDSRIWVFGSWGAKSFSDNPKYLFLYVNQYHRDEIKPIWITKNKKLYEQLRK